MWERTHVGWAQGGCYPGTILGSHPTSRVSQFCGPKWPVWDPLFDPKPLEKVYVGPFLGPFPGNEAHIFSGDPKWGVLGGGQKVYVEKLTIWELLDYNSSIYFLGFVLVYIKNSG